MEIGVGVGSGIGAGVGSGIRAGVAFCVDSNGVGIAVLVVLFVVGGIGVALMIWWWLFLALIFFRAFVVGLF